MLVPTPHSLHTIGSLDADKGGPSRSVTALCGALALKGVRVDLLTVDNAGEGPRSLAPSSLLRVHYSRGEISPLGFIRGNRSFARAIDTICRSAPNGDIVIHDHGIWLPTNHMVAKYAMSHKVARIVSPRGMLSRWSLDFRRSRKRIAWWLYQARDLMSASVIHVTSDQEAQEVRDLGLRQPLAIIGNGINIPAALATNGNSSDERRALFLSRIHPKKGLANLVRAWGRVRPPNWKLIIAGTDAEGHQREIEHLARSEGIADAVEFPGPVSDSDKWALYQTADLFVLPTFSENFGIVVAEALASGVPVITTRAAPWSSLETHGCGWWIEVGLEPLVAALTEATEESMARLIEKGKRGRELAELEFSWNTIAHQMREVYMWLLGGGSKPTTVISD